MRIASKIVKLALEKKMTLSVAESCTGGLLADRITDVPGSSEVFLAGMVSYSNRSKVEILKVDLEHLQNGAVSEDVAREMAGKIRKITGSNIGVGVTGIAGPSGGSPEKPVGTVYYAIDIDGMVRVQLLNLEGSRREIKEKAVKAVLVDLLRSLKKPEQ
ncbi:MAG: CinA family protein [Firmicutes bacterium]|nr:CinA family protein [Bacillota bacterium]